MMEFSSWNRVERSTVLVTLSVARGSNSSSVVKQLCKEASTALNIKDKDTKNKVVKALNKLIHEVPKTSVGDGYIAYSAYDDFWIYRPTNGVFKNNYVCAKTWQPYVECALVKGRINISIKEAVISMVYSDGHEDEVEKITSGIGHGHHKGGQSQNRFRNIRDDEIDFFFRKVKGKIKSYNVQFEVTGEKSSVKRFECIC